MSAAAAALVFVAAVVHAVWNLLSKQASRAGGAAFVWLVATTATLLYLPVAATVAVVVSPHMGVPQLVFVAGTAVLHTAYFTCLQSGYRVGDLSLVYPLARGTGPLLASLAAIALFGERPGPLGLAGIFLVTVGVFVLGMPNSTGSAPRPQPAAVVYGLLTGVLIASYTVWDSYAVSALAIPPLLYMWCNDAGRALLLTPLASRNRSEVRALWHGYRWHVLGTAVLSPLSYILVLTALTFSPVSAIAPTRELSVLLAVLLGGRLLAEGNLPRRMLAAAAIAGGVLVIAVW
ncbi:MAG: EamA family transporter [Streptosporangiales bacterium]|nr:EamA family transporter [Streptosporangiales bacterium]